MDTNKSILLDLMVNLLNKFDQDYCAICKFPLHKKFPDDFPDEWKFCCACQGCAVFIIEGETARSDIFKEIEKKITLVG